MPRISLFFSLWLLSHLAFGQNPVGSEIIVSGTVRDQDTREPLYFASIIETQAKGTSTDAEGGFRLRIDRRSPVTVTFIGYKTTQIRVPPGFAGLEYSTDVLLEKDIVLLRGVNVRRLSEDQFKEQLLELKVETEEEENARDNVSLIRQQGILGVIPQMDGFDNYRSFVSGPQNVTFFSTGPNKGLFRGVKKAVKKPAYSPVRRDRRTAVDWSKHRWNFNKPTSTQRSATPTADSTKRK